MDAGRAVRHRVIRRVGHQHSLRWQGAAFGASAPHADHAVSGAGYARHLKRE